MKALLYVFVAVAGALTSVEAGSNAKLTKVLGGLWWPSILFSLISLACLAVATVFLGGGFPSAKLPAVPWWGWIGGVISAVYIVSMLVAPAQLGSGLFTGLTVTAAIIASIALDHWGLVGFEVHPAGVGRLVGAALDGRRHRLRGRVLNQRTHTLTVETAGKGLVPITAPIVAWVGRSGMQTGLLTVFIRHTSASLLIQENADPTVRADLETFFSWLVPEDVGYRHNAEGPDDMPAHIRSALTQTQLSVPVVEGRMVLGTWQGIYVWEHRKAAHRREVVLHLLGN